MFGDVNEVVAACPHCTHPWSIHSRTCAECGCLWPPPAELVPPPPPEDPLTVRVEDAIWDALSQQEIYVDREMDTVDTSATGVDMTAVAAAVIAALELITESRDVDWYHDFRRDYRTQTRLVGPWVEVTTP